VLRVTLIAAGGHLVKAVFAQTRKQQQLPKDPANCVETKSVKFAGKRLAWGGEMLQDR
jgi:hypothetical protein